MRYLYLVRLNMISHFLQTLMNVLMELPVVCLTLTVAILKVAMSVSVGLATMEMEGALGQDALVSQLSHYHC